MKFARPMTLALLAIFLLFSGCANCRKDTGLDRASDARLSALVDAIPATADAAVVVPEIDEMRKSVDITLTRLATFQPQIRLLEQQIARELGLRITDEQSWKNNGINIDGPLVVAIVGNRPVVATFVEDRNKFESRFIDRARRAGKIESPIRNETVGSQQFKVSGDNPATDLAWFYRGDMVFLAMPPFSEQGAYKDGSAVSVLSSIAHTESENSLGQSEAFKAFRKGLGDHYPISAFASKRYLERDSAQRPSTGFDSLLESIVGWTQSNADGAGIAARADERRIELRAFVSGDDELIEKARAAYQSEQDVAWDGMLTNRTLLAVRTGFDLPKAYETYMESLPDAERRRLRRQMTQVGRNMELDIEEDVIAAFSGHSLIVFFGVGGDTSRILSAVSSGNTGDMVRTLLSNSGLLANLHFEDEEKLAVLLDRLELTGGDLIDRRPLVYQGDKKEDVEIFEPRTMNLIPARLFRKGDLVTIAAAGIGENSAYEYLTSGREEGLLKDNEEFELGKQFADSDGFNGLYVNFENLRNNMRRIPMISGFATQLRPFHELLISGGVDDHGFFMHATLDFTEPLTQAEEAQ